MVDVIKNSAYNSSDGHMCVSKLEEDSCMDWAVQRDVDCNGGDLEGDEYPENPSVVLGWSWIWRI